jgi:hypothetical protein
MKLALLYTLFALIATIINLGSQKISLWPLTEIGILTESAIFWLSMGFGTFTGLVAKYILDKKYIFNFKVTSAKDDSKYFALYTLMGIFTTFFFWGAEWAFDYWYQTETMRYVGGALGLSLGYYIKYQLDKRFVFIQFQTKSTTEDKTKDCL